MPDPIAMAQAAGLVLAIAAMVVGLSWPDARWIVGVGVAYYLGCGLLGLQPRWSIREDLDRLLVLVIPAVLLVELLASLPRLPRWLIWTLRLSVAGVAARVLLHGSIYLSGATGPDSLAWTPAGVWLIVGSMAAAEMTAWVLLYLLARQSPGASLPMALAIAIGGASLTIMMSGYLTGGQAGLPLAAAVFGGSVAAMFVPDAARSTAAIGPAVVGLCGLLVIGRFFGELRTDHAILLFAAPLLAWLPEVPRLRRLPPWARGLLRVFLVALVVAGVVADAARRFNAASAPSGASGSKEATSHDYSNDYR